MVISRLRGQRRLPEYTFAGEHDLRLPHIAIRELDLDSSYLARFDVDALLDGEFLLINNRREVDLETWSVPEASHLWNFNLHYFEWGVALAARWRETGDERYLGCFKRLVSSWIGSCSYSEGDAWHPYTISLRLVNWLVAIDLFNGEIQNDAEIFVIIRESMYRQYRHLLANQETHLRANHWWENLKTLAIMSAAFGEHGVHVKVMHLLTGQLDEQILPDGVHFERSLMYHKLVLEGMLRVYVASDQLGFELPSNFMPKAKSMLDAMASLERGMGKTPFFNDAADGVAKECGPLAASCARLLDMDVDDSKTEFPNAGYYKLYNGDLAVMFDAGEAGPSYMLGHAHCDCLSFELSCKSEPVIVNSGTCAYQSELRSFFRSTAAHNTCVVDGEEQLECWGEHRVGWGYRLLDVAFDGSSLRASVCLPSGKTLSRSVELVGRLLRVVDESGDEMRLESHIHFPRSVAASVEVASECELTTGIGKYSRQLSCLETCCETVVAGRGVVAYTVDVDKEVAS
ncbi:heparinase II/III domain-containing protein [Enorma massiliensis]|uniref:heparinase II/III domain-containing protein n=1 Tax=Enorma massiliensis TaxID=1472761 RepID=UPI003A8DF1A2